MTADLRLWEKAAAVVALILSCAIAVGIVTGLLAGFLWLVGAIR